MALSRTYAIALSGVQGHVVEIEADIENGLVALLLVGLPDAALREARDRIRSAIVNSRLSWPQRRITVGLSPTAGSISAARTWLKTITVPLLKPGELAFGLVEQFTTRVEPAEMRGTLWLRDGIPLLDREGDGSVGGWLLWFEPARLDEAWSAVSSFEPVAQYGWDVLAAVSAEQEIWANVLVGRKTGRGTAAEPVREWSAKNDPVFTEGLTEVRRLIAEAAPDGVASQPDTEEFWRLFFGLQAAYLLLWSVVEALHGVPVRACDRAYGACWQARQGRNVSGCGPCQRRQARWCYR